MTPNISLSIRSTYLPFTLPDIGQEEFEQVKAALESGWITTGPKTKQFETEFAAAVGAKHAIAVNSCTAALHLALEAVGVRQGDEVITTPYTFAASAEVIRYFDATPILVDVDKRCLNMNPKLIEAAITSRTKAILPIHIAGLPAEMDAIYTIAAKHKLAVIEDAAHAFPTKYKGRFIGNTGNRDTKAAACFSFYATKTISTGEGGMICTEDDEIADRCRIMALHGISRDAWKRYTAEGSWFYEIIAPGYKYNFTDIAAGVGIAQLHRAETMWRRRSEIASLYNKAFSRHTSLEIPFDRNDCQHSWHLYMLRLNLERLRIDRNQFIEELKTRNIGASVHFIPLHLHPYYREKYGYKPDDYPVSYGEYTREISLPIYSKMTDQDVQDVIGTILGMCREFEIA